MTADPVARAVELQRQIAGLHVDRDRSIANAVASGVRVADVAQALGFTRQHIYVIARRYGVWTNGQSSMVDVGRAARVSTATVRRVLRDEAYVSAATRERVRAAIREVGYVRGGTR